VSASEFQAGDTLTLTIYQGSGAAISTANVGPDGVGLNADTGNQLVWSGTCFKFNLKTDAFASASSFTMRVTVTSLSAVRATGEAVLVRSP
jgi:hypothetical protein